ncbi:MAG: hypothetical protein ACRDY7_00770 [Acidimicrobiia bacterium]
MSTSHAARDRMQGEGGHARCAGSGPRLVLGLGAQQAGYVFRGIVHEAIRRPRVGYDHQALLAGDLDLLLWEAFVVGAAHAPSGPD